MKHSAEQLRNRYNTLVRAWRETDENWLRILMSAEFINFVCYLSAYITVILLAFLGSYGMLGPLLYTVGRNRAVIDLGILQMQVTNDIGARLLQGVFSILQTIGENLLSHSSPDDGQELHDNTSRNLSSNQNPRFLTKQAKQGSAAVQHSRNWFSRSIGWLANHPRGVLTVLALVAGLAYLTGGNHSSTGTHHLRIQGGRNHHDVVAGNGKNAHNTAYNDAKVENCPIHNYNHPVNQFDLGPYIVATDARSLENLRQTQRNWMEYVGTLNTSQIMTDTNTTQIPALHDDQTQQTELHTVRSRRIRINPQRLTHLNRGLRRLLNPVGRGLKNISPFRYMALLLTS